MSLFWIMKEQLSTFVQSGEYGSRGEFGIENASELGGALRNFNLGLPGGGPYHQPLPGNFPRAQLKFPSTGFAPDYFKNNGFNFVSAKFRQVMGIKLVEEEVVQFYPLQWIKGNTEAVAQDYNLMHIRAAQFAIDIEKSDLKTEEKISAKTQEPYLHLLDIKKLILRQDIPSNPEIFMVEEIPSVIMATDILAQRVLKSGCTGVTFYEPASAYNYFTGVRRYKTSEGIGPTGNDIV